MLITQKEEYINSDNILDVTLVVESFYNTTKFKIIAITKSEDKLIGEYFGRAEAEKEYADFLEWLHNPKKSFYQV